MTKNEKKIIVDRFKTTFEVYDYYKNHCSKSMPETIKTFFDKYRALQELILSLNMGIDESDLESIKIEISADNVAVWGGNA